MLVQIDVPIRQLGIIKIICYTIAMVDSICWNNKYTYNDLHA